MYLRNIKLLSIFNFLIGVSLFAPLAILYFSRVSGSYALGASIFGIAMLSSAVFEIPTGIWSDKVGRKGTFILGSWARVIAFILYAVGLSYWWLVAGAILEGLSRSFFSGNNDAFLHDTLEDGGIVDEYDTYLGKTSSAEHIALAISGLAGSIIASFSFSYLLWITVFFQFVIVGVSYLFKEPSSRSRRDPNIYSHLQEAVRLFLANKKLRLLSIASMARFSIGELKFQFRAAFINLLWPVWAIGLINSISNIGASASFFYSGKVIKKYGELKILMFQTIMGKVISFLAYGTSSVFSPSLLVLPSLMHGVGSVSENKLMQQEFSGRQRATMSSLNAFGGSVMFFLMSVLLGLMADSLGPAKALIIMTVIELPVIYIYYVLFKNNKMENT